MTEKQNEPSLPNTPRDIVKAAVDYFMAVAEISDVGKLRLEEIIQDDKMWYVTLSYPQQDDISIFGHNVARDYKEFTVDSTTGKVTSMKIKKV